MLREAFEDGDETERSGLSRVRTESVLGEPGYVDLSLHVLVYVCG